jgi:hypothetical protein
MTHRLVALALAIVLQSLFTVTVKAETPGPSPDVVAWEAFCDRLKDSGAEILREHAQPHAIDRAEGPRYLVQQVAQAVEHVLTAEDASFPLLRIGSTTLDKWGLDGADAKYTGAHLRGDGVYRLHGKLGSARLIALQLFTIEPDYTAFESLSGEGLQPAPDGTFSLMISQKRPDGWDGPWLPLDSRATNLLVREYFNDWQKEEPSRLMIERLDAVARVEPLSAESVTALLSRVADVFALRAPMWLPRSGQARAHLVNRFHKLASEGQGLKDNVYGNGWFKLAPGEALLIELDDPDALLWSFQLGNYWWESLDFVNHAASLNGQQAVPSSDGRYRLVVSLEDPAVPNWLDPVGHPEGMILYRFQRARKAPVPATKIVPLRELRANLPSDTPMVSAEERRAEIAQRRAHAARRWAP